MGSFGVEPIREGSYVPDVVIFLNPSENLSAIRECTLKNIPTVGIVDTDIDPRLVTYPIPANMEVGLPYLSFHCRDQADWVERPYGRFDPEYIVYCRTGGKEVEDAERYEGEGRQEGLGERGSRGHYIMHYSLRKLDPDYKVVEVTPLLSY